MQTNKSSQILILSYLRKKAISGIALAGVQAQRFLFIPIIIQYADESVYGNYVLITAVIPLIISLSSLGVGFRSYRQIASVQDKEELSALYYPQLLKRVIATVAAYTIYLILTTRFHLFPSIYISSISVGIFAAAHILYASTIDYFRYNHKIHIFSLGTLTFSLINLVSLILYFRYTESHSINGILEIHAYALLFVGLVLSTKIAISIGFRFRIFQDNSLIKDIKFGLPLTLSSVTESLLSAGDKIILASMMGSATVGIYSTAYTVGSIALYFTKVTSTVLPQLLSKLTDEGDSNARMLLVTQNIKFYCIVALSFFACSISAAEGLLKLVSNDTIAQEGAVVTPIIALSMIFYGTVYIGYGVIFADKNTNLVFKVNAICAISNIALNVILLSFFKTLLVPATITLATYLLNIILMRYWLKEKWYIDFTKSDIKQIFSISLLTGLFFALLFRGILSNSSGGFNLAISSLATALFFAFVCYATGYLNSVRLLLANQHNR